MVLVEEKNECNSPANMIGSSPQNTIIGALEINTVDTSRVAHP